MVKIAVLVSGGGTNLQAILDAQSRGEIQNGRVELVLSSVPGAYALMRAEQAGIGTLTLDRKAYKGRQAYTDAVEQALIEAGVELVVLAGYMVILAPSFFQRFENRVMNVHPALIPAFCGDGYYGLKVHEAALSYGVKLTGATVHFVNEITDGGPIILQKSVDTEPGDTPETLQKRVMETCEWEILPRAVSLFCEGRLRVEGRRVEILPEPVR